MTIAWSTSTHCLLIHAALMSCWLNATGNCVGLLEGMHDKKVGKGGGGMNTITDDDNEYNKNTDTETLCRDMRETEDIKWASTLAHEILRRSKREQESEA